MRSKKYHNLSMTLIELLVVIAIIGLLSTLIMYEVSQVQASVRDARRKADLKQLATALELYFSDHGQYPADDSGGVYTSDASFVAALQDYIKPVPTDPKGGDYYYIYRSLNPTKAYKLLAKLEKDTSAMANDGGVYATWYEVYDPNGQSYTYLAGSFYYQGVYYDRYEACHSDATASSAGSSNTAASKQGVMLWHTVNFATAKTACANASKHLITASEWGIIAKYSKDHNSQPGGNNNNCTGSCDRDADTPGTQTCTDDPVTPQRCLTGTGPVSWNHDNGAGLADLNGNVWEWVDLGGLANSCSPQASTNGCVRNGVWFNGGTLDDLSSSSEIYVMVAGDHAIGDLGGAAAQIDGDISNADITTTGVPLKQLTGPGANRCQNAPPGSESYCIGDFRQFAGNATCYNNGSPTCYYLNIPGASQDESGVFQCTTYDTVNHKFTGCSYVTNRGESTTNPDNNEIITSVPADRLAGSSSDWYVNAAYIYSLRTESALSNFAWPASVYSSSSGYGLDKYWDRPYGIRAAIRGGHWDNGVGSGVFALSLSNSPAIAGTSIGFRCSQ